MRKIKIRMVLAAVAALLAVSAVRAAEVAVEQAAGKPGAVSTTVDNATDFAFASDLKAAEDLLKGLSHERKLPPGQTSEYVAREMEKARKFYAFARTTLMPHSLSMMSMMKDPGAMAAEGGKMVAADPSSWRGYDFLASGSLLQRDFDGAMANYQKALSFAPDFQKDWYRYMIAACHIAKKEDGKALEFYEGVIGRNENWLAVKSSYISASMTLLGKDDRKAASYFDKGFSLYTQGEQAVILKTGICDKFKGLEKGPEVCGVQNKI